MYINYEENAAETFEPLLAAFTNQLYGIETEFGKATVRFEGTFDDIDFNDFSDINLTWNGDPLQFEFSLTRKIKHSYKRGYVTDIYLNITVDYEKPGVYLFSGKYKGSPFYLYITADIERINGVPAHSADLMYVSVTYLPVDEFDVHHVTDVSFHFDGYHQWFSKNDLRDVRLFNNGADVSFRMFDYIVRHYIYDENGGVAETVFTLVFTEPLKTPGMYRLSGVYRDVPFVLNWMQWN